MLWLFLTIFVAIVAAVVFVRYWREALFLLGFSLFLGVVVVLLASAAIHH